jgi:dTDP-4-dehydrorhamnose 3,5-epimerase
MNITPQKIPDVWLISPRKFGDDRGFFSETFRKSALADMGFERDFVQDNHSMSGARGTVRGLHFQLAPHQQDKLVRVIHGAILDVAVDIRPNSPSFGQHVAVELSAGNWDQLLVPKGFAHGFQTLTENCEVLYKVTDYYAPQAERGLLWSDPALGISWPISVAEAALNDRDAAWPKLCDLSLDVVTPTT